jgi:transposase
VICELILQAINGTFPERNLISLDEKTGIQALERIEQTAPASKGGHIRREFEYKRNGTTNLMAAINVADGQLINRFLNPTRKEKEFCTFVEKTVEPLLEESPEAEVILMADQLNTHLSESLVVYMAKINGFKEDLGKKGETGILKNKQTRMDFLETQTHKVRFLFTPKHCSWLNPIENWFAKLQRHVIENGNFNSVEVLKQKIENYINFYNDCLLKPLKWKFKGFCKAEELKNMQPSKT